MNTYIGFFNNPRRSNSPEPNNRSRQAEARERQAEIRERQAEIREQQARIRAGQADNSENKINTRTSEIDNSLAEMDNRAKIIVGRGMVIGAGTTMIGNAPILITDAADNVILETRNNELEEDRVIHLENSANVAESSTPDIQNNTASSSTAEHQRIYEGIVGCINVAKSKGITENVKDALHQIHSGEKVKYDVDSLAEFCLTFTQKIKQGIAALDPENTMAKPLKLDNENYTKNLLEEFSTLIENMDDDFLNRIKNKIPNHN